jgi:hypothetical protein
MQRLAIDEDFEKILAWESVQGPAAYVVPRGSRRGRITNMVDPCRRGGCKHVRRQSIGRQLCQVRIDECRRDTSLVEARVIDNATEKAKVGGKSQDDGVVQSFSETCD